MKPIDGEKANADHSCDYDNRKYGIVRCKDCNKYDSETGRCSNGVVKGEMDDDLQRNGG